MARLVLVGLPGVGKTTVAHALAQAWHCAALDTDEVVASNVGMSAPQYLRERGETEFRMRELEALKEAVATNDVVATGGGVVCTSEAREVLLRECTLWLDCIDEEIVPRLKEIDRPLLEGDSGAQLAKLRAQRGAWYQEVAKARIEASGTLDNVLERVRLGLEGVRA